MLIQCLCNDYYADRLLSLIFISIKINVYVCSVDPLSRYFYNTFYCQAACHCSPCVTIGDPARTIRL